MQKDKSTTPTMERTHNFTRTRTPDRSDAAAAAATRTGNRGQIKIRSTMAPNDFALPCATVARRTQSINARRMSVMSTNQLDMNSRVEAEIPSNELGLLYDKYIQALAEEVILKKKIDEREKAMVTQLTALAKQQEQSDEKLHDIQMRAYDVSTLNEIQQILDFEIKKMTTLLNTYQGEPIEILGDIQSMLKSLDTLTCRGIIVPKTKEDVKILTDNLYKCNELLTLMNCTIESEAEALQVGNRGVKCFIESHDNLKKQIAILEDAMKCLQVDLLKRASVTLLLPSHDQIIDG